MPLAGTGSTLGAAIKSGIEAADPKDREALFEAMGTAIINHLIANGVAAVVTVDPISGPLPGNLT